MSSKLKQEIEKTESNTTKLNKIIKGVEPLEDLVATEGKNLFDDFTPVPSTKNTHPILEFIPNNEPSKTVEDLITTKKTGLKTVALSKIYDLTTTYLTISDVTYWKSIGKKILFKGFSKGYIISNKISDPINYVAELTLNKTNNKSKIHALASTIKYITEKQTLESLREYLKEITLSDKFEREKQLSKEEAFLELKKPKYRLGKYLANKLSNLANIKEEYLPSSLKSAKKIRENISALGIGFILGGQIYKRQAAPSAEIMNTTVQKIAKTDFIASYILAPITAAQLTIPLMTITGRQDYWTSFGDALLTTIIETMIRSEIFKQKKIYLPGPTKLITPTTAITTGFATIHEGYHFLKDLDEKMSKKSSNWRNYKENIKTLAQATFGQMNNTYDLNFKDIQKSFEKH